MRKINHYYNKSNTMFCTLYSVRRLVAYSPFPMFPIILGSLGIPQSSPGTQCSPGTWFLNGSQGISLEILRKLGTYVKFVRKFQRCMYISQKIPIYCPGMISTTLEFILLLLLLLLQLKQLNANIVLIKQFY